MTTSSGEASSLKRSFSARTAGGGGSDADGDDDDDDDDDEVLWRRRRDEPRCEACVRRLITAIVITNCRTGRRHL